jgi:hypothetical protein
VWRTAEAVESRVQIAQCEMAGWLQNRMEQIPNDKGRQWQSFERNMDEGTDSGPLASNGGAYIRSLSGGANIQCGAPALVEGIGAGRDAECIIVRRNDDTWLASACAVIEEVASLDSVLVMEMGADDPKFDGFCKWARGIGVEGSVLSAAVVRWGDNRAWWARRARSA